MFVGFLFLLFVFSGQTDIGYLLNITRHEWYRELRRDYFTSRQQFWRDWRKLKQFGRVNGPWIYATLFGSVGLIATVILLIVNLPQELKASVQNVYSEHVETGESLFVTREGTIDTRTRVVKFGEPLAEDSSVLVFVPSVLKTPLVKADPVVPPPILRSAPAPRFEPKPQPVEPAPREVIDFDEAFADFMEPEREPDPEPVYTPTLDIAIFRENPFEVTSKVELVDVENIFVTLRGDRWTPEDKRRVPTPPKQLPMLYHERHGDVHLSQHERDKLEPDDSGIRIRPRAVGREIAPGLLVRKSIAHHAILGEQMTYEIEVTNPHDETVAGLIVEETVPEGWSIVDATPKGSLINGDTLRWDVEDLMARQSHRFSVQVVVGGKEAAQSRTVVTAGAAVESVFSFNAAAMTPDPVTIEPAPFIENTSSSGWRASDSKIPIETQKPEIVVAPALPPGIERRIVESVTLDIEVPNQVALGDVALKFTVRNTGDTRIEVPMLMVWLPANLTHPRGPNIQRPIGSIEPNQERIYTLRVKAKTMGDVSFPVQIRSNQVTLEAREATFTIGTPVQPASYNRWQAAGSR
jgi:uncharacterized repeat protein (TIGR01451 family)